MLFIDRCLWLVIVVSNGSVGARPNKQMKQDVTNTLHIIAVTRISLTCRPPTEGLLLVLLPRILAPYPLPPLTKCTTRTSTPHTPSLPRIQFAVSLH